MRIVFSNYDDPKNPFYGGGGARAVFEIARRLAARHEVTVVAGLYPGAAKAETVEGVRYERIGSRRLGPQAGQLLYQFLLPWQARRLACDVWVESLTPPCSTALLPWFTRAPVVALTQVLAGKAMSEKYHLPFHWVEAWGLRHYRHAIVLSEALKRQLAASHPGLQMTVIPNGVPRELVEQAIAPAPPRHILFLGRIDLAQKGLDLLLEAVARAGGDLPLPVVIAGSGPAAEEQRLQALLGDLKLNERVRCVGRVEGAEKERLFREAVCMVMPSRFEASPLVLIEAFCHQLPVVYYGIPELADIPEDCAVRVPPFEVGALAQTLVTLAGDEARRREIGARAKAFAKGYDWDSLALRYEAFLEQVVRA